MTRRFVIGDIHGCYAELMVLLEKAGVGDDDEIISLGDIINRGPSSDATMRFFLERENARVVRGNHEHKFIQAVQGGRWPTLAMLYTRWQLGELYSAAIAAMQQMPIYIDLPEALLVHAYYEPDTDLEDQQPRVLLGTDGATSYLEATYERPWWRLYDGAKPIIVGHKDISGMQEPFVYRDRVYGLDTGCVYGGQLTGMWLPDFEIVSVLAENAHWQHIQSRFLPHE